MSAEKQELILAGARARVDVRATRDWYAHEGDIWYCMCGPCRNFVAAADKFPEEMKAVLDRFGIPAQKATYVSSFTGDGERMLYEACWHIAGELPEGGGGLTDTGWTDTGWGGWSLQSYDAQAFPPNSAKDFPEPCFLLYVNLWLPWVLDEPMDKPKPKDHYIPIQGTNGETRAFLREVIAAALKAEGVDFACEIDVEITDDEGIRALNKETRGMDSPTDVLSFPAFDLTPGELPGPEDADPGTGYVPLGDMAVSMERVRVQAGEYGHSPQRELAYLAVHSVLHLLGYDHLDEGPMKAQMRAREEVILGELGLER